MKLHCILTGFLFLTSFVFANEKPKSQISFTENKGQICDQNYKSRTDVLYSGSDGQLAFHIKKSGISYQLYRVDSWKEEEIGTMHEKMKVPDLSTIYRIDLNWVNANKDFERKAQGALPGTSNYYQEYIENNFCTAKSYESVTFKNLYNGIDVHYYEKNNVLKYDYIVHPFSDYKQIRIKIEGVDLKLNPGGELLLITPLGTVSEGKPIVYQNGKEIGARWTVNKNIIGFELDNYDPKYELTIDPPVRLWGTYYGGTGNETGMGIITDIAGNVYMSGNTTTSTSTLIATSGSHQVSFAGSADAILAKFNANGVRQWATYYGGSGSDAAYSCTIDKNGDIYMVGSTTSSVGTGIATPGSHQPTFGGGTNYDGFLVKFNSGGIRQWGTYYGGTGADLAYRCRADRYGYIYVVGETGSPTNIATPGSHQPTGGTGGDGFVVKFNAAGVRQWGTYYGGTTTGSEEMTDCAPDSAGNIYVCGHTINNVAGVIATPGSHQSTNGGGYDAYLVKFNANGVRQWATYYGGAGTEQAGGCTVDSAGYVYLSGHTSSSVGIVIATPGSHQPVFGGASTDGMIAKFDPNGTRLWGTYYGGTGDDRINKGFVDRYGNTYFVGYATPTSTVLATPGSPQVLHGGGLYDGIIVMFNKNGVRQWGSFYGGTNDDFGLDVTRDTTGNLFMNGYTKSSGGISIASVGSHQPAFGGGTYDNFLAKFSACPFLNVNPTSNSPVCSSTSLNLSAASTNTALTYSWTGPLSFNSTLQSPTITNVSAFAGGVYTVSANNGFGCIDIMQITVTVNPSPVISVNSGVICSGDSFTLNPTSASTYTFMNGGPVVSPTVTTSYSVIGTSALGCLSTNTTVSTVVVSIPVVSVTPAGICIGDTYTITPTGALTYTFSGGSPVVSPTTTTSYTITGTNSFGCKDLVGAVLNLTVNPLPIVSSNSSSSVCPGTSGCLNANGAATYTWTGPCGFSSTQQNPCFPFNPSCSCTYTVTGADVNGCKNTSTVCLNVYPSPTVVAAANNTLICAGLTSTLTSGGADTYTWSTSSTSSMTAVSPTTTSTYSVTGTNLSTGCNGSASVTVTVNPLPVISVSTSDSLICGPLFQETAVLSASGASSYTWNTSATTTTIAVSPSITTTYSVTGTDVNGCEGTAIITQSVSTCIGIEEIINDTDFTIYPNPTSGSVYVFTPDIKKVSVEVYNVIGERIYVSETREARTEINLLEQASGIYFIKIGNVTKKIVRE